MSYRRLDPIVVPTDPAVLGYLAGIVDGEGYIGINSAYARGKSVNVSHGVRMTITNCDARLIAWLGMTIQGGIVGVHARTNGRARPVYRWNLHGRNAVSLLAALVPFLVIKKEQAEVAIQLKALGRGRWSGRGLAQEVVQEREALKQRIHLLNRRGAA